MKQEQNRNLGMLNISAIGAAGAAPVDEGDAAWGLIASSEAILAGAEVTEAPPPAPPPAAGMLCAAARGPSTISACGLRSTYESKGDTGSPDPSMPCACDPR